MLYAMESRDKQESYFFRSATPADLIAALRAMATEEREEVLGGFIGSVLVSQWEGELSRAAARAEQAEREVKRTRDKALPETRAALGAARDEYVADAAQRVVSERDSLRARVAELEAAAAPVARIDPERLLLVRDYIGAGYCAMDAIANADHALALLRGKGAL